VQCRQCANIRLLANGATGEVESPREGEIPSFISIWQRRRDKHTTTLAILSATIQKRAFFSGKFSECVFISDT